MRLLLAILFLLFVAPAQAQQSQGMSNALVVNSCGGGTLPSGALNQLTMDPTGRLCQSGIGSNVCPQATAYLARTTGGNEGGNAVNITALICGLVTDGVIDGTLAGTTTCGTHLDGLWLPAQQNAADAYLNLCGTSYPLVQGADAATFTAYRGFQGFSIGFSSGFNPTTAPGPHYTQTSANIGLWTSAVSSAGCGAGIYANTTMLCPNFSGSTYYYINTITGSTSAPVIHGLYEMELSSPTNAILYVNGMNISNTNGTAAAPYNNNFVIGASNDSTYPSASLLSAAVIGASLGATLQTALYTRLSTYMTAVGVP